MKNSPQNVLILLQVYGLGVVYKLRGCKNIPLVNVYRVNTPFAPSGKVTHKYMGFLVFQCLA